MKITKSIVLLVTCTVFLSSFRNGDDHRKSLDPLSIPLEVRKDWLSKGNLVPNPSFEHAEIFKNDSSIKNFKLQGWNVIGNNVQLTDIGRKGVYDKTDAWQGTRAIKIVRTQRDVTEINNPKEGVESDFINVIPGNYDFYFYIRLKDVIPALYPYDRFQTRIDRGIDIRLKFYDKDMKEISPKTTLEYVHKQMDNGFKGYAFSNYFYVTQFDWGKVRGETWHYPFSEGDLPDNCSFVKIFLGLACPGTMWIDDIDFRLSKWNFTPLERMESFFTQKYDRSDLLLPTPQSISNKQSFSLKNKRIEIINPGNILPEKNQAIQLLEQGFSKLKGSSVKVLNTDNSKASSNKLQIIFIEKQKNLNPDLMTAFAGINGKEQGYFIRRSGNKIFIGANQTAGWFYGASTLSQLIDESKATLDYADITDYPDFTGRSVKLAFRRTDSQHDRQLSDSAKESERNGMAQQQLKDIDFYAYYKLNDLGSGIFGKQWWQPNNAYNEFFKTIGDYCIENYKSILRLNIGINPYAHLPEWPEETSLNDSLRNLFSHGSPESFTKITNALKPFLDAGARTVVIRADDHVPHIGPMECDFTLFTKSDKEQFVNLADAQAFLLNKTKAWLNKNYGEVRLEFIPASYSNRFIDNSLGSAEGFFRDLNAHLDPSVVFQWTGTVVRSLSYDMADLDKVLKVYGRKPMVFDNTPYARLASGHYDPFYPINYPPRSVMCNLFEPHDIAYPENFSSYLDSHYYSNNSGSGEVNKIKNLTFADFTWNTKDYNADFSLFKALVKNYGATDAMLLLKFNDAYFKLVASWGQVKLDSANNPGYKIKNEQRQIAEDKIKEVRKAFDSLSPINNPILKQQLKEIMNTKIEDWNKLVKTVL